MNPAEWQDRIAIDPEVRHGKPCIKGTRIMVSVGLDCVQYACTEQGAITAAKSRHFGFQAPVEDN